LSLISKTSDEETTSVSIGYFGLLIAPINNYPKQERVGFCGIYPRFFYRIAIHLHSENVKFGISKGFRLFAGDKIGLENTVKKP